MRRSRRLLLKLFAKQMVSIYNDWTLILAMDHTNFSNGYASIKLPCCIFDDNSFNVLFFDGLTRTISLGDEIVVFGQLDSKPDPSSDFIRYLKKGGLNRKLYISLVLVLEYTFDIMLGVYIDTLKGFTKRTNRTPYTDTERLAILATFPKSENFLRQSEGGRIRRLNFNGAAELAQSARDTLRRAHEDELRPSEREKQSRKGMELLKTR